MAEHDDDAGGIEIGWAVQVAPVGEWLAVSRRQLSAVREAWRPAVTDRPTAPPPRGSKKLGAALRFA